jgi:hypothetical protein
MHTQEMMDGVLDETFADQAEIDRTYQCAPPARLHGCGRQQSSRVGGLGRGLVWERPDRQAGAVRLRRPP